MNYNIYFPLKTLVKDYIYFTYRWTNIAEINLLRDFINRYFHNEESLKSFVTLAVDLNKLDSLRDLNRYDEAFRIIENDLPIIDKVSDLSLRCMYLLDKGNMFWMTSRYDEALNIVLKAYKITGKLQNKALEVRALSTTGIIFARRGEFEKAFNYHSRALKIAEKVDYIDGITRELDHIGIIYAYTGRYNKAYNCFEKALRQSIKSGDKYAELKSTLNLANIYYYLDKLKPSLKYYQKALQMSYLLGEKVSQVKVLGNIAMVYTHFERYQDALKFSKKALHIARQIRDKRGEGINLNRIGHVYYKIGKFDLAEKYYISAVDVLRSIGDLFFVIDTLKHLSKLKSSTNSIKEALIFIHQALQICKATKNFNETGKCMLRIGELYTIQKKFKNGLKNLKGALKIFRQINNQENIVDSSIALGKLHLKKEQIQRAKSFFVQAKTLAEKINYKYVLDEIEKLLSLCEE